MCFMQRSVICHLLPSRPEKHWAGRGETSVTDLEKVTLLAAKQSQRSRPYMNRIKTLGFVFDGEVSPLPSPLIPRDKITAMTAT